MAALWRDRRWRFLLNLVDHLPRDSAYGQAIADDDELAAVAASDGSSSPAVSEWSSEVELLAAVYDRLGDVINAVAASGGGKPVRVRPWPRPLTAADRAAKRRKRDAYADIIARVLPDN